MCKGDDLEDLLQDEIMKPVLLSAKMSPDDLRRLYTEAALRRYVRARYGKGEEDGRR